MGGDDKVRVIVRERPFNSREKADDRTKITDLNEDDGSITVVNPSEPDAPPKQFSFDTVFGNTSRQSSVFDCIGKPICDNVMEGFNATIFCYGQTGTGKSHTMEGTPDDRGIMAGAFKYCFDSISLSDPSKVEFMVRCAYLEIYNENIRDLLSPTYVIVSSLKHLSSLFALN